MRLVHRQCEFHPLLALPSKWKGQKAHATSPGTSTTKSLMVIVMLVPRTPQRVCNIAGCPASPAPAGLFPGNINDVVVVRIPDGLDSIGIHRGKSAAALPNHRRGRFPVPAHL